MSHAAARVPDQALHRDEPARVLSTTWPHQLSHEPSLRVSDVLAVLVGEFPALTPSKLRFFDTQGLVSPQRTASGYRQYSASDVERLRFVLREQRDFYRPLGVISETLARLDTGELKQAITPRDAAQDAAAFVSARALAALAGVGEEFVNLIAAEKLVVETTPGGYDRRLAPLVTALDGYVTAGGDVREARVLRNAARREVDQARSAARTSATHSAPDTAHSVVLNRAQAAADVFAACVEVELQ